MICSRYPRFFAATFLSLSLFCAGKAIDQAEGQEKTKPNITVSVKQTAQPSIKTFYKVPVDISITNNTARDVFVLPPYFKNLSFWSLDNIRSICRLERDSAIVNVFAATVFAMAVLAGKQLNQCVVQSLESSFSSYWFAIFCGAELGYNAVVILKSLGKCGYLIQPSVKSLTIKGYISKAEMAQVNAGTLVPEVVLLN